MTAADALAIELALDRLDARAEAAMSEYLLGRWRERERALPAPLPAVFVDPPTRARLEAWRHRPDLLGRRAEMLWRWYARAEVEDVIQI